MNKKTLKQECIPVGCVPSAAEAISGGGGRAGGVCLPGGGGLCVCPGGGESAQGVSA